VFSDLEYMGSIYPTVVKIEGVKILKYMGSIYPTVVKIEKA